MTKLKKYYTDIFPENKLYLLCFQYYVGCSTIKLVNKISNKRIHVIFDGLHSINVMDRGEFSQKAQNIPVGYYVLEDSEYLTWFHKQSFKFSINSGMKHYLISTVGEVISIIAAFEPEILLTVK